MTLKEAADVYHAAREARERAEVALNAARRAEAEARDQFLEEVAEAERLEYLEDTMRILRGREEEAQEQAE